MKELFVVRHAQPDEGHPVYPGDPPLHKNGRLHARRLARRLQGMGIDRIYSSSQRRALATAGPLATALSLEPVVRDGLTEVDHGAPRYRSVETMRREEPERWAEFVQSPIRFFGKDPVAYQAGVVAAYEEILADPNGTRVAVFSHGMAIKVFLSAVLGLTEIPYHRFSIAYCSVTRLSGASLRGLRIDSINESYCTAPTSA